MGLLGRLAGAFGSGGSDDMVPGTARVVSCSPYAGRGAAQTCTIQLVIEADGVEPTASQWSGTVRPRKWPAAGQSLPVTVHRGDPHRFSIRWSAVPAGARSLSTHLRGGADDASEFGGRPGDVDDAALTPEQRAKLHALGIDPGMLAAVQAAKNAARRHEAVDAEAQLARIEDLRVNGVLTSEEYVAARRRLGAADTED